MIIFFITLLPFIQNVFISFITAHRPGAFSKLQSLLSLPFFGFVVFAFALCCLFSKTISVFFEDVKNTRLITILTIGIGILLLGFVSFYSYQNEIRWLNSDHASEMVLGKLLADENALVSRNWHYSTEIRIIYQTIFFVPLFKLLGRYENWALIRSIAIFFNNLILILSYLFMTKQMKIQKKWGFITSLLLVMPVSTGYWDIVTFGGYYIFFIAQLFCCIGLFLKLTDSEATKTKLIDFILFTILSFILGVQGIRSLLSIYIPLFITCIYLYLKSVQKKKLPVLLGCYCFVLCCIGFMVNYLMHFLYTFHSFENMCIVNLYDEFFPKLCQSLVCLMGFFGLSTGSSLLSANGLFSAIAIIGTFIFFWIIIKSFCQTKIQNNTIIRSTGYNFLSIYFIVSVIFNIFVFIIVDESVTDRYFIPFMVLYIPIIAMFFEHTEKTYKYLKRIAVILGIFLFILGQSYLNLQNIARQNINSARKGYVQYLLDNKLDYGFATYCNANITTELSNGKIQLAGLTPDGLNPGNNNFLIQGFLNHSKFYDPYFHQGESFLLLTQDEWEIAQTTNRPFAKLTPDYKDNNYIIIRYPSAEIIHREVLDIGSY